MNGTHILQIGLNIAGESFLVTEVMDKSPVARYYINKQGEKTSERIWTDSLVRTACGKELSGDCIISSFHFKRVRAEDKLGHMLPECEENE